MNLDQLKAIGAVPQDAEYAHDDVRNRQHCRLTETAIAYEKRAGELKKLRQQSLEAAEARELRAAIRINDQMVVFEDEFEDAPVSTHA